MPDYTTDERWRRGPRKHTARRWYNSAEGGLILRCDGCDYEPVKGTTREQEDAHRAHRVAMGENVKAQRVLPRGVRLKQAEAERDRYRLAWQSARFRAEAHSEGSQRHIEARDDWKGWMHEQAQRADQAEAAIARVREYCELLAADSCRVAARETAQDVLRLLDGDSPTPGAPRADNADWNSPEDSSYDAPNDPGVAIPGSIAALCTCGEGSATLHFSNCRALWVMPTPKES